MATLKQGLAKFYRGEQKLSFEKCFDAVEKALQEVKIYSDLVMIAAMATVRVEVGKNFKPIKELSNGKQYEGRKSLGNTEPGDGPRFVGRGLCQLTGRYNYTIYSELVNKDLIANPGLLITHLPTSALVLAHLFKRTKAYIHANKMDWLAVRKAVNGVNKATGLPNGWEDFLKVVNDYTKTIS